MDLSLPLARNHNTTEKCGLPPCFSPSRKEQAPLFVSIKGHVTILQYEATPHTFEEFFSVIKHAAWAST